MDLPHTTFMTLTDMTYASVVEDMMAALYTEDPAAHPIDPAGFRRTIEHFVHNPTSGSIVLFTDAGDPAGYAILIPFWSNEFGGQLVFVDELFVMPEYRGRGIARAFFTHLRATRPGNAMGLALEVTPGNVRAQKLYASLGFQTRKNLLQFCVWDA